MNSVSGLSSSANGLQSGPRFRLASSAPSVTRRYRFRRWTVGSPEVALTSGGLVNLFKLYKDLAAQPPSISIQRLSNEVAAVRNRAVHSGQIPSKVDAHKLVNHAKILVNEVRALPQP